MLIPYTLLLSLLQCMIMYVSMKSTPIYLISLTLSCIDSLTDQDWG